MKRALRLNELDAQAEYEEAGRRFQDRFESLHKEWVSSLTREHDLIASCRKDAEELLARSKGLETALHYAIVDVDEIASLRSTMDTMAADLARTKAESRAAADRLEAEQANGRTTRAKLEESGKQISSLRDFIASRIQRDRPSVTLRKTGSRETPFQDWKDAKGYPIYEIIDGPHDAGEEGEYEALHGAGGDWHDVFEGGGGGRTGGGGSTVASGSGGGRKGLSVDHLHALGHTTKAEQAAVRDAVDTLLDHTSGLRVSMAQSGGGGGGGGARRPGTAEAGAPASAASPLSRLGTTHLASGGGGPGTGTGVPHASPYSLGAVALNRSSSFHGVVPTASSSAPSGAHRPTTSHAGMASMGVTHAVSVVPPLPLAHAHAHGGRMAASTMAAPGTGAGARGFGAGGGGGGIPASPLVPASPSHLHISLAGGGSVAGMMPAPLATPTSVDHHRVRLRSRLESADATGVTMTPPRSAASGHDGARASVTEGVGFPVGGGAGTSPTAMGASPHPSRGRRGSVDPSPSSMYAGRRHSITAEHLYAPQSPSAGSVFATGVSGGGRRGSVVSSGTRRGSVASIGEAVTGIDSTPDTTPPPTPPGGSSRGDPMAMARAAAAASGAASKPLPVPSVQETMAKVARRQETINMLRASFTS